MASLNRPQWCPFVHRYKFAPWAWNYCIWDSVRPPDLLTGLVAWYRSDGTDQSGNGNDLSGALGTTTGFDLKPNSAIAFDGGSIYSGSPLVTATPLSFAGWFKVPVSVDSVILFQQHYSGLGHPTSNQSIIDDIDQLTAMAGADVLAGPAIEGLGWVHLAFTISDTTWKLYVNGNLVSLVDNTAIFTAEDTFELGSLAVFAAQYFGAWSVALTRGQVAWLADGNDPTI